MALVGNVACNRPLKGWKALGGGITFRRSNSTGQLMTVPCGKCMGCRFDYARDWMIRCVHEASMHAGNAMITLTYAPESLPPQGGLRPEDFTGFMKRLRLAVPNKIKFFQTGEYGAGGPGHHPHHHALIFGFDFPDKYYWTTTKRGTVQYRSPLLESKWEFGNSTVGLFDRTAAAYCARYVTKKIHGDAKAEHYRGLKPEYVTMSRGGTRRGFHGLGASWFQKFYKDVFPDDFIVIDGRKYPVPRYYDEMYEEMFPGRMKKIKAKRAKRAEEAKQRFLDTNEGSFIHDHGDAREELAKRRNKLYERNLENGTQGI